VREQGVVLEDRVDVAPVGRAPRDVDAVELHGSGVGLLEAGDQPQRRGLARAGRAEQGEELAAAHLEVEPVHGGDVAVGLAHADQADGGRDRPRPLTVAGHRDAGVGHV